MNPRNHYYRRGVNLYCENALKLYKRWPTPITIVSDGPYGLGSFLGDPHDHKELRKWYEPHIKLWSEKSSPQTTLWFWNSEVGWATVHSTLEEYGWQYRNCHIWNKGPSHIAGNANTKTLRKFPVVTEICVQYVRKTEFKIGENKHSMQDWLRHEWGRTGLPLYLTNAACGVRNAATRKYLTSCHLWYYPPPDAFIRLADYANEHGNPAGRPYFSLDGKQPISKEKWAQMRAKFNCKVGIHNVWNISPVNGSERVKKGHKCVHLNQKPLAILDLILAATTDPKDVVWEPFGGLCSTAIASFLSDRKCYSSEILQGYYDVAVERLRLMKKTEINHVS